MFLRYWIFIFGVFCILQTQAKLPLIYPKISGSNVKLIFGFGVPWDGLLVETITSGIVWRIHFHLPGSLQQLRHRTVTKLGRQFDDDESNSLDGNYPSTNSTLDGINESALEKYVHMSYRWGVYRSMEGLAERMGLNGRVCVLKSICEASQDPFHYANGLWGELMYILLTPSSSVDKLSEHSDNDYYQAEYLGRSGGNCESVFGKCPRSLLSHFSNFYKLTDELREIFF
ncbi:uncharacterized protein LOC142229963 [Haematobia irritans]|uniref:uncharacterized protein LOC142229963 n=1 Tax=Haematobia irritans TaxID=7368 RepID=UPI003F4F5654